jgi:hypothetical protein
LVAPVVLQLPGHYTLEKELEEAMCLKNEAEAKMCGLEKWKEKYSKTYQTKATYLDKITGLKRRLKEKDRESSSDKDPAQRNRR